MKVREIMTKDVACVNENDPVETAAKLMKQYHVGSIPVCNRNEVVGIVTDRDVTLRTTAQGKNSIDCRVGDVMSRHPVVGTPEMDVQEAARMMSDRQIRRLPIVNHDSLVGIVALGDISENPVSENSAGQALKGISQRGDGQM